MELSQTQQEIFESFKEGENIFMTGPGGSGKTFIIKEMYKWCIENNKKIQVCALTGCACVLLQVKAKTIHSWAGIGLANGEIINIIKRVIKNIYKKKNWLEVDILIIDEVSMMSYKLLSILDGISKMIRKNNKPFGGIQIIFSGDFYQLPPVGNINDIESTKFCFENPLWEDIFDKEFYLDKIFRQTDDMYINILNEIREGRLTKLGFTKLQERLIKTKEYNEIKPTKLLPRRFDVNLINNNEMKNLSNDENIFILTSFNNIEKKKKNTISDSQINLELDILKKSIMVDEKLILKKGAQVMCIINIDTQSNYPIINGSCGIIVDFDRDNLPIVQFKNGCIRTIGYHIWESEEIEGIGIKQIPLIPAWAISIHRAQGSTLDNAEINIGSGIFECGQTYVALSRVKDIEGLYLTSFDPKKIKINKKVKLYYERFNNQT